MAVSANISVASGSAAAQSLTGSSSIATVNPGDKVTVSLTTTTGVQSWSCQVLISDYYGTYQGPSLGFKSPYVCGLNGPFSFSFTAPMIPFSVTVLSEVSDGSNQINGTFFINGLANILGTKMSRQARVATAAALSAYTASGGVLTANSNGALGTIDGVTVAAGDRVLLTLGAANADNGLYVVTSLGGASSKFVLTRAPDYATGSTQPGAMIVTIREGTVWAGSDWKSLAAADLTVDTTDPKFYPRVVKGTQALSGGAATVSNLFVWTAAGYSANDNTAANAVKGALTSGLGTGSIALTGTTTDTIQYVITNW